MIDVIKNASPIPNDTTTRILRALEGLEGVRVAPGDADHLDQVAGLLRDLLSERAPKPAESPATGDALLSELHTLHASVTYPLHENTVQIYSDVVGVMRLRNMLPQILEALAEPTPSAAVQEAVAYANRRFRIGADDDDVKIVLGYIEGGMGLAYAELSRWAVFAIGYALGALRRGRKQ